MIEISLLPVDEEAKPKTVQKGLGFRVPKFIPRGFGIAIAVLLVMYTLSHLRASSSSRTLTESQRMFSDLKKAFLEARMIGARLGPAPGEVETMAKAGGGAEGQKDSGERLRKRAEIFQTCLENRTVWSRILQEITVCCPEEVRLTEIKLSPLRTLRPVTSTQQGKEMELVISGFYLTGGNLEMIFKDKLVRNKTVAAHYKNLVAMTRMEGERTYFWINCREQ